MSMKQSQTQVRDPAARAAQAREAVKQAGDAHPKGDQHKPVKQTGAENPRAGLIQC